MRDRDSRTRSGARAPGVERHDVARMAVLKRATPPAQNGDARFASGGHEGWTQTRRRDTWTSSGKAPPDKPALKPYRGKPAVRNFRGDGGNVGIMRSPLRASVLPDRGCVQIGRVVRRHLEGASAEK